MSDHSISIVAKISAYPDKDRKAAEILDWLILLDIVQPVATDCTSGSVPGYAVAAGARAITDEPEYLPFEYQVNGLEIVTERQIFSTGENGLDNLICPECSNDIAGEDWSYFEEWAEGRSNHLTCPLCQKASEIHRYAFTPEWGFSDLGFTFWSWPAFTPAFLETLRQKLGCEINVVYDWI